MRIATFTRRFISVFLSICLLMTTVFMVGYSETVSAATTDVVITVGTGQTWSRPRPTNAIGFGTFTTIEPRTGSQYYSVYRFIVSTTSNYTITASNHTGTLADPMFYLYTGSFDAANPVSPSFTVGNDDSSGLYPVISSVPLTAGTIYYLVTTGFSGSRSGTLNVRFNEIASGTVSEFSTVSYTAAANGTISGTTPQNVPINGNGTPVTAVPNTGYHFTGWSDGASAATRSETNVISDISLTADFAINQYALTYTAGANGTIIGTTSQTVTHGSNGTQVTALPDTGYYFAGWSDGVSTYSRTDTNITAAQGYTANFAINNYTLTYTAGLNGTLSGSESQSVDHGNDGTAITAVPDTGYHFIGWSDGVTTATRTDTNVMQSLSLTANFAINNYTLTYIAGLNGTLSGSQLQSVDHGNDGAAVTAVADTGYHFIGWSDSVMSESRTDLAVTKDITVTANFAINSYTLAYAVYAAGTNGTLTGNTAQSVEFGSDGSEVTAVPNTGYHFAGWSDGVLTASRTELNVLDDLSVTANFAINSYTLTYAAAANGTLSGSASQMVDYGSAGTAVTAIPAAGYHFTGWSDGVLTAARTDLDVTDDLSVTADFAINSYTLTYAAGTNGTLTGIATQAVNYGSDGTEVTAIPAAGYHFTGWSDGVLTAARTDMDVTDDLSVIANFAINSYTLTYAVGTNGTLTGITTQAVNYGSDGTEVTAIPATGYHFTGWSDGVLTAARTDMDVTDDLSVTANFAVDSYTVIFQDWDGSVLSEQTVDYGTDAVSPANPVRSGYTFTSWSLPFTGVTGNIITVAVYSQNPAPTATPTSTPTVTPTATPTVTPAATPAPTSSLTPVTGVLGADRASATPTAVPATGVLGAAKTGEADNQNMITAAFILLAGLGVAGTVFVVRRKKNKD